MKIDRAEFLAALMGAGLGLAGCDAKAKKEKVSSKDEEESEEEQPKKKKKKKKKTEDSADKPKVADKAPEPPKKEPAKPTAPGGPDLTAILGGKSDGFAPLVFSKLKENMTAAEAGKVLPGGDKVDEFGFAEIKTGLPAGVAMYSLSFLEKKLKFAEVIFPKSISDDAFWNQLVAHLKTKLAPVEMSDVQPGKKHLMWIGPGFKSITLSEKISMDESLGFEINYAVI